LAHRDRSEPFPALVGQCGDVGPDYQNSIINTYSGSESQPGDEIDKGISLFVKEHEKDLPPGVQVELIRGDDTGPNPSGAQRLAQELVTRDQVK
jgi:ABC-type branched-subunit amino acid transport system substrate-binding protein